jgi:hypothetical protein
MPYTMAPEGYRALLIGSATSIEDLGTFAPLEESANEGAFFLMRLDLSAFPSEESLNSLEQKLADAGVEMWPGYGHYVYAVQDEPIVYVVWQKGLAWIPIIVGILATTVLPPLLMAGIWLILPQEVKSLITGFINLGMMALVMFIMMQVMKPLTASSKEKPKRVEPPKEQATQETTA